jgi:hypothetical protein
MCTTRIKIKKKSTFYSLRAFVCVFFFLWMSEQTAVIPLCSVNLLVFITGAKCVYCAVRAESLHTIIHVNCGLFFPQRSGFNTRSGYVRFIVESVSLGQVFLRAIRFFPISIFPPKIRINHHFTCSFTRWSKRKVKCARPWNLRKKNKILWKSRNIS